MHMSLSLAGRPETVGRRQLGRRAKCGIVTGAVLVGVLGPMGVAMAEGGFDSSLSGVRDGFTTREWTDKNLDTNVTKTYVAGCSRSDGATFTMEVELRKDVFGPDTSYGNKDFANCTWEGVTHNWGDPGSGTFFNQIHQYSFGTISANHYNVHY